MGALKCSYPMNSFTIFPCHIHLTLDAGLFQRELFAKKNFNFECNLAQNICAIINNQLIKNSLMQYHRIYFRWKIYFTKNENLPKLKEKQKQKEER